MADWRLILIYVVAATLVFGLACMILRDGQSSAGRCAVVPLRASSNCFAMATMAASPSLTCSTTSGRAISLFLLRTRSPARQPGVCSLVSGWRKRQVPGRGSDGAVSDRHRRLPQTACRRHRDRVRPAAVRYGVSRLAGGGCDVVLRSVSRSPLRRPHADIIGRGGRAASDVPPLAVTASHAYGRDCRAADWRHRGRHRRLQQQLVQRRGDGRLRCALDRLGFREGAGVDRPDG